jgi:hypothetical protein
MIYELKKQTPPPARLILTGPQAAKAARLAKFEQKRAAEYAKTAKPDLDQTSRGQSRSERVENLAGLSRVIAEMRAELAAAAGTAEHWDGARLIKIRIPGKAPETGPRGEVEGFSAASRRRLMEEMAKIKREAHHPLFITLTFPPSAPALQSALTGSDRQKAICDQCRAVLRTWWKTIRRKWPKMAAFWRLEIQPSRLVKRDEYAPHFHLLCWGHPWLPVQAMQATWSQATGTKEKNSLDLEQIKSSNGVMYYCAKYLSKEETTEKTSEATGLSESEVRAKLMTYGRTWGKLSEKDLPWGEKREIAVKAETAEALILGLAEMAEEEGKLPDPHKKPRKRFVDAPEKMPMIVTAPDPRTELKNQYAIKIENNKRDERSHPGSNRPIKPRQTARPGDARKPPRNQPEESSESPDRPARKLQMHPMRF